MIITVSIHSSVLEIVSTKDIDFSLHLKGMIIEITPSTYTHLFIPPPPTHTHTRTTQVGWLVGALNQVNHIGLQHNTNTHTHTHTHSQVLSLPHSLAHSLTDSPSHSLARSFTHPTGLPFFPLTAGLSQHFSLPPIHQHV